MQLQQAGRRAQVCTDGLACKRRVCFFAHHEGELRKVDDEGAPAAGKDAELLAGAACCIGVQAGVLAG